MELFGSVSTSLVRLGYGVSPSSRVRCLLACRLYLLTYLFAEWRSEPRDSPLFFRPPSPLSSQDLTCLDLTRLDLTAHSIGHRCGCDCRTSPIRRRLLPVRHSKQPTESDSTLKLRPSKRCERRHGFSGRPLVSLSLNRCSVLNESQIAKSQLRRMIAKTAVTMLRAKLGREFAHR